AAEVHEEACGPHVEQAPVELGVLMQAAREAVAADPPVVEPGHAPAEPPEPVVLDLLGPGHDVAEGPGRGPVDGQDLTHNHPPPRRRRAWERGTDSSSFQSWLMKMFLTWV